MNSCARSFRAVSTQQGRAGIPQRYVRRPLVVVAARKTKHIKNIVCHKTLTAKKEHVNDVLQLCKDNVSALRGVQADMKSGLLVYECVRDQWDDHVFYFWERYESVDHFLKQNGHAQSMIFMQKVQPLLEGPIGMVLYEWRDGKFGASCVYEGPKGEGGYDDATGAQKMAGGASMQRKPKQALHDTQVPEPSNNPMNTFKKMFEGLFSGKK